MKRLSFRARVFMLVVVVVVATAAATAWLTVRQAVEQAQESAALARQELDHVVNEITRFGLLRGSWQDVAGLVSGLARSMDQRVRVVDDKGATIADSAPSSAQVSVWQTIPIDTRPLIRLSNTEPASMPDEAATILVKYQANLEQGRCWEKLGIPVVLTTLNNGLRGFERPKTAEGGECEKLPLKPGESEYKAAKMRLYQACAPEPQKLCVQQKLAKELEGSTPPPVQVLIGTVDQPQRTEIELAPALIAAGLVALIALVSSLLISRRVLRPIASLAAAARRVGDGDLTERVPERGHDELAQLSGSFNRMADSLQRSREQQHNMISDIAHELRTPLANVRNYVEALDDGVFEPGPDLYQSLREEVLLQQRLVDDLQDLALAESGSLELHFSQVDLIELANACRAAHASAAMVRGVRIEVTGLVPVFTTADPVRLRQVIGNLLANALHATPRGGQISLRVHAENDWAVVEVADTGHGIAPAHASRVFDRFWRADAARSRDTGGRGLGLAIARELVTAQGGVIELVETSTQGTVFAIRLPLV